MLSALYFVHWDRYVNRGFGLYSFYGWIDREKDNYKDFIVLDYSGMGAFNWLTSSAARDKEIQKIVDGFEGLANPCQRIEHGFDIKNVIKLK